MPITEKEALEVLGFDDVSKVESVDAFKADVEKTWVKLDSAHNDPRVTDKVFGKANRTILKELTNINTEFGLELEIDEKAKPVDVLKSFSEAFKPRLSKVKELEEKLKTAAPADVVEKFEQEKRELDKKLKAFEKNAKEWESKFTELDTKVKNNDRTAKVNGEWDGALKAIPFASTVDELRKEGFVSKAKSKYQVLIDDEGKPYAANDKGEPLMNPKKAAERWTLADALKAEADALKLIATNPQGGKVIAPAAKPRENDQPAGRFARERRQADRIM